MKQIWLKESILTKFTFMVSGTVNQQSSHKNETGSMYCESEDKKSPEGCCGEL